MKTRQSFLLASLSSAAIDSRCPFEEEENAKNVVEPAFQKACPSCFKKTKGDLALSWHLTFLKFFLSLIFQ